MEALILFEEGDILRLQMKDMQEIKVIFHAYDYDMEAMIVKLNKNLEAFEFNTIESVMFERPIVFAKMINAKLALSQQTINKWRESSGNRRAGTEITLTVGNGILTASTNDPIPTAK